MADAIYLQQSGKNERANGAMYLGGFVLECLLKARLLEEHLWLQYIANQGTTPGERLLWNLCYRSHDLAEIVERLPLLQIELRKLDEGQAPERQRLVLLKQICGEWTIFARYSPKQATARDARDFLGMIREVKECLK